jgi:hypothetical protein
LIKRTDVAPGFVNQVLKVTLEKLVWSGTEGWNRILENQSHTIIAAILTFKSAVRLCPDGATEGFYPEWC